jgi:hypothetical protein
MDETRKILAAVKRHSRSVRAVPGTDPGGSHVAITPPFQHPYTVRTVAEWEQSVKDGKCELPDDECPAYGPLG